MNIRRAYTPLTIGAFFVTAVSGMLMFFEIGPGSVRATHEWLSLFFVGASLLHVYNHFKSFLKYFTNNSRYFIFAGLFLGCVLFLMSFKDIYSADAAFEKLANAKVEHIAPLFDVSPLEIVSVLNNVGIN